ncbi:hypothetical protein V8E55_011778 [Tylopilus felleus]
MQAMGLLPSFDNTLGALFIGFSVSTMVYGVFLVQVYHYYHRYPSDKAGYKVIVALLLILETTHQAFNGHSVYYYAITNYMNMIALLDKPVWSLVFQLLGGAVVGAIVKLLFTLRVWRFSYGNVYALPALPDLVHLRVVGIVALGIGVLNDIGVAAALCYYLQSMRSSYTQSDSLIRSLTLYAVNTGVLTSAMSFATLIIYNFMPRNFIFVGCYFVQSKLYGVSFVATLNTRQIIRGRGTDGEAKGSPGFEIVVDRQCQTHSIPLQIATIKTDTSSRDVESGEGQERQQNSATFSALHDDFTEGQRPYYTVGW